MDLKDIKELIRFVSKAGVHEVQLEKDDFKIVIKTAGDGETVTYQAMPPMQGAQMMAPQQQTQSQPQQQSEGVPAKKEETEDSNLIAVKAPMIGTFYRSPGPDKDVFVKVGDTINKGDVLCIIEAMKLFNEIESEVSGKIVKILVDDAQPVEYDQTLMLVEPS